MGLINKPSGMSTADLKKKNSADLKEASPQGGQLSAVAGALNTGFQQGQQAVLSSLRQAASQQAQGTAGNWTPQAAQYASPGAGLAQQGGGSADYDPYAGLTDATRAGLQTYGQQYTPSQTVSQARQYLQDTMNGKPADYSSRWQGQIENLYNEIMNRPKFQYDVNKDPLFQQYKTQYMQTGQRAMQDAMGQAAALSGGYGNSWGNTAGYQAYQYYLSQLGDRGMELEQRAFDRYTAEGDTLRQNLQTAQGLEDSDYARYRNLVGDWQTERELANRMYESERNADMNAWQAMQNYYQNLAGLESGNYQAAQQLQFNRDQAALDEAYRYAQLQENQRQYDNDLGYRQYQAALDEAYRRDQLAENTRQYDASMAENQRQYDTSMDFNRYSTDLDEAYRRAQLAQNQGQFDASLALDQAKFDFQVRQYEDALAKATGGGGGGGGGGDTPTNTHQPTGEPPYNPALLDVARTEASGQTPSDAQLKKLGLSREEYNKAKEEAKKGSLIQQKTEAAKAANPLNKMAALNTAAAASAAKNPLNVNGFQTDSKEQAEQLKKLLGITNTLK